MLVDFGGVPALYDIHGSTLIDAIVPDGFVDGPISVTDVIGRKVSSAPSTSPSPDPRPHTA